MATLCEELSLRTQRLQPTMKRLHQIGERMVDLHRQINRASSRHSRHNDVEAMKRELAELVEMTLETPEQFRADAGRSKKMLEDIGGVAIQGYRAATFSIGASNLWALDVLAELGFAYSSSIYPIHHDLYGMPEAPRAPFRAGKNSILEVPLTTLRLFGRNFPASGGGYFRLLPYAVSRWSLGRVNTAENRAAVFYLHPWEIDPGQPRVPGLSAKSSFRHYLNLARMERRLERLLGDFAWGAMDEVFLGARR